MCLIQKGREEGKRGREEERGKGIERERERDQRNERGKGGSYKYELFTNIQDSQ